MPDFQENTTLICLFHSSNHAETTIKQLHQAGIAPSAIVTLGGDRTEDSQAHLAALKQMGVPERDLQHLHKGLDDGGSILAVQAVSEHVDTVQRIFAENKAEKIDEVALAGDSAAAPLAATGAAIPIVEEELQVGKRTVDQGGVRVFRRVVEMPVEASVNLREEHVVIERKPVDRAATAADLTLSGRVIELTETAEESFVGKSAHVVEEVVVGKQVSRHTEHITDTVRKTQVEVEEIASAEPSLHSRTTL